VTITDNEFSALYNADRNPAQVTIQNSILANSTNSNFDCVNGNLGTVTVVNPNLVETESNCGSFTLTSDPQLGPLQNNGGPTWTHALLTGSPAIDAGATNLTTDQRNYVRPAGAADDIGAYEYGAILAVTLASFDAQAQAGHVLVTWQTVSEMDNAGFNLYRTGTADPPTAADLLAYVPSQGPGSTQGYAYSYPDYAVTAGQTYWYWLEDVDFSGGATLHGPVSVVFSAPTAVTLSGLEAAADRPTTTVWPWLAAAALAAGLAAWRRRRSSAA
jgi:MYXO-CTERM domain-containing protein